MLGIFFLLLLLGSRFAASSWCPHVYELAEYSGSLSSPLHSELYPDNLQCTWRITAPSTLHIQLTFTSFRLEECSDKNCYCDSVTIYDVTEDKKNVTLGKYCGTNSPGTLYSSGRSLIVVFRSDHGDSNVGFMANYQTIPRGSVCRNNGLLLANGGTVTSPYYPNRYPDSTKCTWIIQAEPKSRIKFQFLNFRTEDCPERPEHCPCDYVEVHDGNSTSSFLIGRYCGSVLPTELFSSGRFMMVTFVSDQRKADKGFVAEFSTKQNEECSCPASWRFPFRCPKKYWRPTNNATSVCCYDNGAACCEQGGNYCLDAGNQQRTYCPRPRDDNKKTKCCTENGKPSCCLAQGNSIGMDRWLLLTVLICTYLVYKTN